MQAVRALAERRPIVFVIALAIVLPLIAFPLVAAFRISAQDIVPLRAVIPVVQSVFVLFIVWALGWRARAGLVGTVRDVHLLWFPTLVAFVPVFFYGTIEISWGWIVFYSVALVATGVSEEVFARGIAIPALMRYGKWGAVVIAAAIFSAGHISNIFFEDFGLIEWIDKFGATFGFAILYGAVFLRTGNLWPLIVLHAVHDFSYLTSGTAGPFLAEPIDVRLHMALSVFYATYGCWLLAGADGASTRGEASGGAAATSE